jgi:hypothetical protein
MQITRHITAIAIVQVFALGCAILFSGFAAKLNVIRAESLGGAPQILQNAHYFRDFGFLFFLVIVAWVGIAVYFTRSTSFKNSELVTSAIGVFLSLYFFFVAARYLYEAIAPDI